MLVCLVPPCNDPFVATNTRNHGKFLRVKTLTLCQSICSLMTVVSILFCQNTQISLYFRYFLQIYCHDIITNNALAINTVNVIKNYQHATYITFPSFFQSK